MVVPPGILVGLWFLLRNKSRNVQKIVIFSLTILNLLQHLLKIYIYPQYWGEPFGARSTWSTFSLRDFTMWNLCFCIRS